MAALLALASLAGCPRPGEPIPEATLLALARSLAWLEANPPAAGARLGNAVLDAWAWERFARLHPDPTVRRRAEREARQRFEAIETQAAAGGERLDFVALSYWATALRCMASLGLPTEPTKARLARADLPRLLSRGSPTTAFWSRTLLRRSGLDVAPHEAATVLAEAAARPAWEPSQRDAVAIYHELAAAADLGRTAVGGFSDAELAFARKVHPALFAAMREQGHTDAAAEVLIGAVLLGQRGEPWFAAAVDWLRNRQRPDGSYVRAAQHADPPADERRHGVLLVSWALLESIRKDAR